MATRRRRSPRRKKSKLVLLLLPIILLAAILIWLFFDVGQQYLSRYRPTAREPGKDAQKQPAPRSSERILDPERKKLDEILKTR